MCGTLRRFFEIWSSRLDLAKSKPFSKHTKPVYQGPRLVRIMNKMEVENLVSLPLTMPTSANRITRNTIASYVLLIVLNDKKVQYNVNGTTRVVVNGNFFSII